MKIISLTENGTFTAKAKAYINNDKKHFNIIHGAKGFWEYRLGIVDSYAKPENENDELILDKDNYIIKPVMSKALNDYYKDARGNNVYNVAEGNAEINNDCLVLWTIPNKRYINVNFKVEGLCEVIAIGENGIERPDAKYISPAPVVEIYGSCTLTWTAEKLDGTKIRQVIKYNYREGSFNTGVVEELTEG